MTWKEGGGSLALYWLVDVEERLPSGEWESCIVPAAQITCIRIGARNMHLADGQVLKLTPQAMEGVISLCGFRRKEEPPGEQP